MQQLRTYKERTGVKFYETVLALDIATAIFLKKLGTRIN